MAPLDKPAENVQKSRRLCPNSRERELLSFQSLHQRCLCKTGPEPALQHSFVNFLQARAQASSRKTRVRTHFEDCTMLSFGFAWGKLYLATAELAATEGALSDRVRAAYWHLAPLNSTNVAPETFLRLKSVREEFARSTSPCDEDDGTVTLQALTAQQAAAIASEIVSMFDEVAKAAGAEQAVAVQSISTDDTVTAAPGHGLLN
jgi:hypothetical protein